MTDECKAVAEFLGCDYELCSHGSGPETVLKRFNALSAQGKADGFFPLIIIPSDTLLEAIEENKEDSMTENMAAYCREITQNALDIDVKALLSERYDESLKWCDSGDILGRFVKSEPQTGFHIGSQEYEEGIIAKIPAENPWELAAWIPMGGFNECPTPAQQVAVFRYWHEKYGAVPAVVAYDTWQMTVTKPPSAEEEAEALAKEQFAFCADIVTQGTDTIRGLASGLLNSPMWFFWWD
jgi:hypothetical protein